MQRVVTLPTGKQVTLGAYVTAWQMVKDLKPDAAVTGWEWFPVPAAEVLADLRRGLDDRINRRGGVVVREASETRILRQLRRRVRHDCRWCGQPLGRYAARHERFCDAGCRASFGG